jgi:hypothetical protein
MEARQEGPEPAELLHAAVRSSNLAGSTAEAVDQILASTEEAVASIRARTEEQVSQIAADLEARGLEEALERRLRLEQVRRELADRASTIATAYEAISQQLWAIDAVLGGFSPGTAAQVLRPVTETQQGMEAQLTLRERQRISLPYDQPASPSPDQPVAPIAAGATEQASPPLAIDEQHPARRWWAPWQREAA